MEQSPIFDDALPPDSNGELLLDAESGLPAGAGAAASVRAVDRAIEILQALTEARRSLGIREMAERTGQPPATVHRLLATLIQHGWVEHSRYSARYRLGPGLLGTAAVSLAHAPLLDRGRPLLTRVAASSNLDAYLSVLVGRRVTFLERAAGSASRVSDFHPGITQPAHCTSPGKVLLAFLPEATRRPLLHGPGPLRRYTAHTITDATELAAALAAVRAAGYAEDQGEFIENWRSVAAPVFDANGTLVAALSCGGPRNLMTPELLPSVRAELIWAAGELSRRLGLGED